MPASPAIYWIADRLAPKFRKQFLSAVTSLRGSITITTLSDAVRRRGVPMAIPRAFQQFEKQLGESASTLNVIWERTARQVEKQVLTQAGVVASFDIINPAAVDAAQHRSSLLVRQISAETRGALQNIIARSINEGIPPIRAAREIRPLIGLTSRQAAAVQNYRASLRAAGSTIPQSQRMANRYADKLLRDRSMTIARTETIRSAADGQLDAWRGARSEQLINQDAGKEWIAADDERTCPICGDMDGEKVGLDVAFSHGVDGPPAHPRCRCTMALVAQITAGRPVVTVRRRRR